MLVAVIAGDRFGHQHIAADKFGDNTEFFIHDQLPGIASGNINRIKWVT